jgi:CheY-like chemotaxis protein
VQVRLERVDSCAQIVVSDTGMGIEPDFLPYVFNAFRQADGSSTRVHGGLGLGLAIVRHLVELHGGTITAQSAGEQMGATFTVKLPLSIVHDRRQAPAAPALLGTPPTFTGLEGVRVLVVDDESDARDLLRRILEECKAQVTAVSTAREGLELLQRTRPHVLLSDIGMPDLDGYDLIRQVRQLRPDQGGQTPAVALTAYARIEDRRRAMLAGFQVHIAKPVEPTELTAVIANLAGQSTKS